MQGRPRRSLERRWGKLSTCSPRNAFRSWRLMLHAGRERWLCVLRDGCGRCLWRGLNQPRWMRLCLPRPRA